MTPAQIQAIAAAEARMRPALDLNEQRCKLWRMSMRLPLRDLMRLNWILADLSDDDMRQVAAFAEGLAEWNRMEQGQSGGQEDRTTPGPAPQGPPDTADSDGF